MMGEMIITLAVTVKVAAVLLALVTRYRYIHPPLD